MPFRREYNEQETMKILLYSAALFWFIALIILIHGVMTAPEMEEIKEDWENDWRD